MADAFSGKGIENIRREMSLHPHWALLLGCGRQ
jgi:hypothetical protein